MDHTIDNTQHPQQAESQIESSTIDYSHGTRHICGPESPPHWIPSSNTTHSSTCSTQHTLDPTHTPTWNMVSVQRGCTVYADADSATGPTHCAEVPVDGGADNTSEGGRDGQCNTENEDSDNPYYNDSHAETLTTTNLGDAERQTGPQYPPHGTRDEDTPDEHILKACEEDQAGAREQELVRLLADNMMTSVTHKRGDSQLHEDEGADHAPEAQQRELAEERPPEHTVMITPEEATVNKGVAVMRLQDEGRKRQQRTDYSEWRSLEENAGAHPKSEARNKW